jgi:hypothetical protein
MGKDMSRPKNVGIAQSRAHNSRIIREMFALREIHVPRIRAPVGQSNISIDMCCRYESLLHAHMPSREFRVASLPAARHALHTAARRKIRGLVDMLH